MDLESGDMPLEARLEDMGIDPQEYKTYVFFSGPRMEEGHQ